MKTYIATLLSLTMLNAVASTMLQETFETLSPGSIDGQGSWTVESGTGDVQTNQANGGTQALNIQSGSVSHALTNGNNSIWTRFEAFLTEAPESNPTVTAGNTSVAFFVNTNLTLTVYSNTTPVELSTPIPTNVWVRFDVYCDYEQMTWNLSMNSTNVAAGLPLYSANQQVDEVLIANHSSASAYVDDIQILDEELAAEAPDLDSDGLPDWWEQKYGTSITALSAGAPSGNNGYTYLQTYIAGISPISSELFKTTQSGPFSISWNAKEGRIYDVLWSPSMQSNFTTVALGLPASQSEFTDLSNNTLLPTGFYKVQVRVE